MTGHWDAALFGAILFIAFLLLLLIYDHRVKQQTAALRARYAKRFSQHADEALALDQPIPYVPADGYTPVWTTGAAPEDVEARFNDIMRTEFLGGES